MQTGIHGLHAAGIVSILASLILTMLLISGCDVVSTTEEAPTTNGAETPQERIMPSIIEATTTPAPAAPIAEATSEPELEPDATIEAEPELEPELTSSINIIEDFRNVFVHGDKPAEFQKYIMLHDTEGESSPGSVVDWWAGNGNLIAAHFVIGKDGTVVQCVPLDKIAHHAGWGSDGHNEKFGVTDESRDDLKGRKPTSRYTDYGMNSYSVGIELVHVGGSGDYPAAQLEALDGVIAHIDEYFGFESEIIDHKMWRTGNSDTSPEFATYLENYRSHRSYE